LSLDVQLCWRYFYITRSGYLKRTTYTARPRTKIAPLLALHLGLSFAVMSAEDTNHCAPLTDTSREKVFAYLRAQFKLSGTEAFAILQQHFVDDTCYRQLTIGQESLRGPLVLYLSPDGRFLSASLLDLNAEPKDWREAAKEQTSRLLESVAAPVRVSPGAPVTIIEFSDFECPYCRRFNQMIEALPPELAASVRHVYKYLPSGMHAWAEAAAIAAACAQVQSDSLFWQVHDLFFQHQDEIDSAKLPKLIADFAVSAGAEGEGISRCIHSGGGVAAIAADRALAKTLNISVTPTVFINGERFNGVPRDLTGVIQSLIDSSRHTRPSEER